MFYTEDMLLNDFLMEKVKNRVKKKIDKIHKYDKKTWDILYTGEIGEQLVYEYLHSNAMWYWRAPYSTLPPQKVYRFQAYYDEYKSNHQEKGNSRFIGSFFSQSDLTIYPFLVQVKTTTKLDYKGIAYLKAEKALKSDIYILVFSNKDHTSCEIKGWISGSEILHLLKKNSIETRNGSYIISENKLHTDFTPFINIEIPSRFMYFCDKSKAHKLLETLVSNAYAEINGQGNPRKVIGPKKGTLPCFFPLIYNDRNNFNQFLNCIYYLHKTLSNLGYSDAEIKDKKVPFYLVRKALIQYCKSLEKSKKNNVKNIFVYFGKEEIKEKEKIRERYYSKYALKNKKNNRRDRK
jgi:hypothetical protein